MGVVSSLPCPVFELSGGLVEHWRFTSSQPVQLFQGCCVGEVREEGERRGRRGCGREREKGGGRNRQLDRMEKLRDRQTERQRERERRGG